VVCFREVLRTLAYYEKARAENCKGSAEYCQERQVIGVMIGWRGAPILTQNRALHLFEKANVLSFYSRKNAAHTIGQAGYIASVVGWLRTLDRTLGETHPNSRVIFAGHSFGGAILFSAISGVINEEIAEARYSPRHRNATDCATFGVDGIGDMVLLLNPAFEGLRFHSVANRTRDLENCPGQRNVLITVASKQDIYNKHWFRIGRYLATLFATATSGTDQKQAARIAIGHYEAFKTHELHRNKRKVFPEVFKKRVKEESGCACPFAADPEAITNLVKLSAAEPEDAWRMPAALSQTRAAPNATDCITPACLDPVAGVDPFNPVKVIWADGDIVSGHSDIYNPRLLDFLIRAVAAGDRAQASAVARSKEGTQ
jgi:hypothetical protein